MDKLSPQYEENIKAALQGLKRRETDISGLVEKSIQGLEHPSCVNVRLIADIHDPSVWIDEERIFKALQNLETNSVEAMPDGGELTVHLEERDEQVTITIEDTGRGISRENMDNILTPFFTTKPVGEGTGLGLPFAYGAIKMHGGSFTIDSNADPEKGPTGTRVVITIPRARPDLSKVILEGD